MSIEQPNISATFIQTNGLGQIPASDFIVAADVVVGSSGVPGHDVLWIESDQPVGEIKEETAFAQINQSGNVDWQSGAMERFGLHDFRRYFQR